MAYIPRVPDELDEILLREQSQNGIVAPPNFIVVGIPVERPPNRFHRFIDQQFTTEDYTILRLRDGREIVVGTKDGRKFLSVGYEILRWKAANRRDFPFDGLELAADVPVALAYWGSGDKMIQWPFAASEREIDLSIPGLVALVALLLYGALSAIGWVVRGFLN